MRIVLLTLMFSLSACRTPGVSSPPVVRQQALVEIPSGDKLRLKLALSDQELMRGLSGLKPHEFSDDEGMLFVYPDSKRRYFWMPDTYFDLDIFFLDENLRVLDVERSVPHHPGYQDPIPTTRLIWCRHVLELKSSSNLAQVLDVGDQLRWLSQPSLATIQQNQH